jgi:hypothetical protein
MNRYICTKCSLYCYSAASLETMRDDHCPYPGCGGRIVPAPEVQQAGHIRQEIKRRCGLIADGQKEDTL